MTTKRPFGIIHMAMLAIPVAALAMVGTVAAAPPVAPSPKAAIAARQAGYKKMGAAMKALNDQLKSNAPTKAIMVTAAQTIATTAREQPKLFPAGTGSTAGVPTDALPNIWTERAAFDEQMAKLIAESGKLLAVTNSGNADAIRLQAKATGATCAGCHRQFRADN
jgi:cytochrome c556